MSIDKLKVLKADITKLQVDVIVNAANTSLAPGGGVCGAIHRAAGPDLAKECETLGECPVGLARITRGYQLPAKYVIHAVGPIWQGGNQGEALALASCYRSSLQLALDYNATTIAFPAISCGIYGYPLEKAVPIAVKEVNNFLKMHEQLKTVFFVCFDDYTYETYQRVIASLKP